MDLLEPSGHLLDSAKERLAAVKHTFPEGHVPGAFLQQGLETFSPPADPPRYDCIWLQWHAPPLKKALPQHPPAYVGTRSCYSCVKARYLITYACQAIHCHVVEQPHRQGLRSNTERLKQLKRHTPPKWATTSLLVGEGVHIRVDQSREHAARRVMCAAPLAATDAAGGTCVGACYTSPTTTSWRCCSAVRRRCGPGG